MDVEDVDVIGLQFLKGVTDGDVERFGTIAGAVAMDAVFVALVGGVGGCVFGGDCHFVAQVRAGVEPFAYPKFGFFGLVVVGRLLGRGEEGLVVKGVEEGA